MGVYLWYYQIPYVAMVTNTYLRSQERDYRVQVQLRGVAILKGRAQISGPLSFRRSHMYVTRAACVCVQCACEYTQTTLIFVTYNVLNRIHVHCSVS